ncbi:MAG: hypothetical protein U0V56_10775 [Actinomycetota bacterium]
MRPREVEPQRETLRAGPGVERDEAANGISGPRFASCVVIAPAVETSAPSASTSVTSPGPIRRASEACSTSPNCQVGAAKNTATATRARASPARASVTPSNWLVSGIASRVKSSTVQSPPGPRIRRIGPSSDRTTPNGSASVGEKANATDERSSSSRRISEAPGTLSTSNGTAGPTAIATGSPSIVPGNPSSWTRSQRAHRRSSGVPTSRASSAPPSSGAAA